jgi:hypothetical protein
METKKVSYLLDYSMRRCRLCNKRKAQKGGSGPIAKWRCADCLQAEARIAARKAGSM